MNSALNEPLNARIELLAASPEELEGLTIAMASSETFERYGIDRPFYLQGIQFNIVRSGRADGNFVQVRSTSSMAEPFITILVEASWSRGRLLREYTVFLDPPTFAPPSRDTAPAVQAPSRTAPADSGRIERQAPAQPSPAPAPRPAPVRQAAPAQPKPQAPSDDVPFDMAAGGDYNVQRSETLWGIASRVRPDNRLTMNQTMLAIFEANPEAFGGNINILRAGAALRVPSADEIFRINRGEALAEAQRQHAAWSGGVVPPVDDTSTRPSLVLVPPDDDYAADTLGADTSYGEEPVSREDEIEQRIAELEADVPQQPSLIEIRDNELASLRQELANIRGEVYEPPVDDPFVSESDDALADEDMGEDPFPDYDDIMVDDADEVGADDDVTTDVEDAAADEAASGDIVSARTTPEPSLVDKVIGALTGIYGLIAGVVIVVGGLLFWFMRRSGDDDDDVDSWQPLDTGDDLDDDSLSATESLKAPARDDESIMVVEQESTMPSSMEDTAAAPILADVTTEATGQFDSLEDTFSSETAINLDQTDPIAEADFHMAYGLYDQAADLINGALSLEPERHDLLTKLCEIYFVWGNRDAFIDSAGRLKSAVGGAESADWDKIVIMGQQIAADDALFAGASAAGATKEVDLSFEAGMDESGELDMEFMSDSELTEDIVDLGGDAETVAADSGDEIDFFIDSETGESEVVALDADTTAESPTIESPDFDVTKEMPEAEEVTAEMPSVDATAESPTIEEQFDSLGGTAELPSLDESGAFAGPSADATAEINLDDLGLDVDSLAETELASFDDLDATAETEVLEDTGINEVIEDAAGVTGRNPAVDPDATGVQLAQSDDDTGISEALLDATGLTQVLPDDLAVETASDVGAQLADNDATMLAPSVGDDDMQALADDAETLLASLDDDADEADFDFAKTEALPKDAFSGDASLDETGELPAVASTDVDLDLDDLTAALQVSDAGDTVEQMRDDATVEQPRPNVTDEDVVTVALGPDEISDDLSDARTMTEVGTKLDLARAYVDMGDPAGARSILEEVLDEGDDGQRQQAQQLLDSLPS
jgi:pilus assembly protein FimV